MGCCILCARNAGVMWYVVSFVWATTSSLCDASTSALIFTGVTWVVAGTMWTGAASFGVVASSMWAVSASLWDDAAFK